MIERICKIEGCLDEVKARKLCNKHYQRLRNYGDPLYPVKINNPPGTECLVDGCHESPKGLGYCGPHYFKFRRYGDPLHIFEYQKNTCSVQNCNKAHLALGYCSVHYQKFLKYGDPLYESERSKRPATCSVPGCNKKHAGNGYCWNHNRSYRLYGDPLYLYIDPNRTEKICTICGELKPVSKFPSNDKMTDKTINQCKECINKKTIQKRKDNPEHFRRLGRIWSRNNEKLRKRKFERYCRIKNQDWYKKRRNKYIKTDLEKNKEKILTRDLTKEAIKIGELRREPCIICGDIKSQVHHNDYSDPMNIIWLCRKHHVEIHVQLRNIERGSL